MCNMVGRGTYSDLAPRKRPANDDRLDEMRDSARINQICPSYAFITSSRASVSTSNDTSNDESASSLPGAAISAMATLVALPREAGLKLIVVAGIASVLFPPWFVTTPALVSNGGLNRTIVTALAPAKKKAGVGGARGMSSGGERYGCAASVLGHVALVYLAVVSV